MPNWNFAHVKMMLHYSQNNPREVVILPKADKMTMVVTCQNYKCLRKLHKIQSIKVVAWRRDRETTRPSQSVKNSLQAATDQ